MTLTLEQLPEYSFYVKRCLSAEHRVGESFDLSARLRFFQEATWDEERMQAWIDEQGKEPLESVLRDLRRLVMLSLITRDCTGKADYFEVVNTMTALAQTAIRNVVAVQARALAARYGVPMNNRGEAQDFIVFGMGKLGGGELNVSSDIDLIFIYDEQGETRATEEFPNPSKTLDNFEFFQKLSKKVIRDLSDITDKGFVFRVDMRLRPNGDSGPIVVNSDMLEEYLYTQGREWERFAWLKARVVNQAVFTDPALFARQTDNIKKIVKPFVFRKYVDFNAIGALSDLHRLIRQETIRREAGRDIGINVKLGHGGIREIEFLTQTFQIIRGGRDVSLRSKQTLTSLKQLGELGLLTLEKAQQLTQDYIFLRNLEHAIQYVDDQQTHVLSNDEAEQSRVAALLGVSRCEMLEQLARVRSFVSQTFDGIFQSGENKDAQGDWPEGWFYGQSSAIEGLQVVLDEIGYRQTEQLAHRILTLMGNKYLLAQNPSSRENLAQLVRRVCDEAAKAAQERVGIDADEILLRVFNLLDVIVGRSTYVALLCQYPQVTAKVVRFLAASEWAASYLVHHPIVLDELVDGRSIEFDNFTPVDWSRWQDNLWLELEAHEDDQEAQMNIVRDAHHGALFQLLVADLQGRFTMERLSDQLSALADAMLDIVITLAWQSMSSRHRTDPKFAVIAYGKLGGKELGYASDLDLIYLYDDEDEAAAKNYTRLVRRMMSWLTVQTSSGILFDVDLRLRPNGENGLLVSSLDMFRRYQRNEDGIGAWPWEHQALTRARFCAGDREIGRAFEQERAAILQMPRQAKAVFDEVLQMREKILDGHPNRTEQFNIKHDRGGMVDVEFAVQAMVLAYSAEHPELVNNFGNILLLQMMASAGLIAEKTATDAADAYRHYRAIQREARLQKAHGAVLVDPESILQDRRAVERLWFEVFSTDYPQRK